MTSSILPSLSLHSSGFHFSHTPTPTPTPTPFTVDSCNLNMEIFGENSADDTDDGNDGDYSPVAIVGRKSRLFTKKYAPQAVVDWYRIALDKKTALKKPVVKSDAIGHLLATGWTVYYTQKNETKVELRYKSPTGKVCISLRTACKVCIDQGGAAMSAPPIQVPDHSQTEKKDSHPPVGTTEKETAPFLKKPKDDSECVKSPVPLVRNLGNKKTVARAVAKGTSRRNPRTALHYLIDQGLVSPGDRVYYYLGGKDDPLMAWGSITNEGFIKCDCCYDVFSISSFEAHTGSTKRRPAANIFLEDGRSLLDCQKQLPLNQNQNQNETKTTTTTEKVHNDNKAHSDTLCGLDKNDSICSICHFGGELILCDLCPAAFHGKCLGFKSIPLGDWFCPSCCCKICGQVAYDFVHEVSPSDASCVKCVQCEQNVHIGCVKCVQVLEDHDINQNIDKENWFCTKRCKDIHMGLQELLWKQIPVGEAKDNLTFTLMKYSSCSDTMGESQRKKFNIALGVMHESFRPVKDPITKKDLLEDVLFSRRSEFKRLNFEGFYTVVLERKNIVATVATVKVHGEEMAEVPFVATRLKYRRHGMCRALMKELEQQLLKLGVKRLTLPAAPEALNTWTAGFGFSKMTYYDRLELVKNTFLGFQHTVRCQKYLSYQDDQWIPNNNLEWGPRKKRLKRQDYDISQANCFDDWNSISHLID